MTNSMRQGLLFAFLSSLKISSTEADLVINEIAYKGSGESFCDGQDWVELFNSGEVEMNTTKYVLHDDKGADDEDAHTLTDVTIAPGDYLVLCKKSNFQFGIGADDIITLLDGTGTVVDSVALPGTGSDDEVYALIEGEYKYTATATPGEANIYSESLSLEEQLQAQNDAGNDFFLQNDSETFSKVVDISVTLSAEDMDNLQKNPNWEVWVPYDELSVSNIGDTNKEPSAVSTAGKIRVKGQYTKWITACQGFKSTPFDVKFDVPIMGIERMYFRNHLNDQSYMRDHASNVILKEAGLPYLRTRPARFYLNGSYIGLYTVMEAPDQAHVMQRSFGAFDPEKTALFKAKTFAGSCPFQTGAFTDDSAPEGIPETPYYERGEHRDTIPVLGDHDFCFLAFLGDITKDINDVIRTFRKYDGDCGMGMVDMGRIDRDFGDKSIENPMIAFLNNNFYNDSVDNLSPYIDARQWIQNIALLAITLNVDSVMGGALNNFYMASTGGGYNDWKIVQYDHSATFNKLLMEEVCQNSKCKHRMIYWPILNPTCTDMREHKILGRILNNEDNIQMYLEYVQEYVDMFKNSDVIDRLYDYGHAIKEYIMDDPNHYYTSVEEYEKSELAETIEDYNSDAYPYLTSLQARLEQVQLQLDAIKEGTLPRENYGPGETCPDWRNSDPEISKTGVEFVAETCDNPACSPEFGQCFENYKLYCSPDGEKNLPDCQALSFCDNCFPYSRCGSGALIDPSGTFVESEVCPPELSECVNAAPCFDHNSGICAFDGEILTVECQEAVPTCKPCFPNSRCGTDRKVIGAPADASESADDESDTSGGEVVETPDDEPAKNNETSAMNNETSASEDSSAAARSIAVQSVLAVMTFIISWCWF